MSSLSAAIFVNDNINLASAKKSSHSSGGDSNDAANGDIVSSKGSNGDSSSSSSSSGGGGGGGKTTTTPSTDQGNAGLSTTNLAGTSNNAAPLTPQQLQQPDSSNCNTTLMVNCGGFKPNNTSTSTSTTNTPTSQQQQKPDSSNCNTKLMIGCVTGGSVQCIVAPCGPSSTTSTNAAPLTPQQQYQQCASGIGGAIPGNCSPPPATITEQNRPLQTLNPQQTCQDGSTPDANGVCPSPSTLPPVCPPNQILNNKGHCMLGPNATAYGTNQSHSIILADGRYQLFTDPPIKNTNTIAPVCPEGDHLYLNYCVSNDSYCPSGTAQDEDDITCSPIKQNQQVFDLPYNIANVNQLPDGSCPPEYHYQYTPDSSIQKPCVITTYPKNPDGSCPIGLILSHNECVKMPVLPGSHTGSNGGGFIQMFPESPPATKPPATSPSKTSQYLPPPVVK
ncbi:MAG: hypothetical protein ACTHKC_01905 [Candidatus Nitrosocosmicus sp.]